MCAFLSLVPVVLAATASLADAKPQTRYLELINRANDSVISLATAAPGSDTFIPKPLAAPLPGGGNAITIEVASETCRLDFRFTFRTGRSVIYRDIDICRNRGLRIQRLRSAGDSA